MNKHTFTYLTDEQDVVQKLWEDHLAEQYEICEERLLLNVLRRLHEFIHTKRRDLCEETKGDGPHLCLNRTVLILEQCEQQILLTFDMDTAWTETLEDLVMDMHVTKRALARFCSLYTADEYLQLLLPRVKQTMHYWP